LFSFFICATASNSHSTSEALGLRACFVCGLWPLGSTRGAGTFAFISAPLNCAVRAVGGCVMILFFLRDREQCILTAQVRRWAARVVCLWSVASQEHVWETFAFISALLKSAAQVRLCVLCCSLSNSCSPCAGWGLCSVFCVMIIFFAHDREQYTSAPGNEWACVGARGGGGGGGGGANTTQNPPKGKKTLTRQKQ